MEVTPLESASTSSSPPVVEARYQNAVEPLDRHDLASVLPVFDLAAASDTTCGTPRAAVGRGAGTIATSRLVEG
jgi:hypothetical protein